MLECLHDNKINIVQLHYPHTRRPGIISTRFSNIPTEKKKASTLLQWCTFNKYLTSNMLLYNVLIKMNE